MKILTKWLRSYLPALEIPDRQLADDLTLRGIAVEGVFHLNSGDLNNGSLFEMDITTNRVDAMNHYGIARETAAIYDVPLQPLDASLPAHRPSTTPFPVRIEAPELCGRFTARVLRDVTIAPATGTVAEYFSLLEQKQISNAVDATNFTTQAMGHPTHAFDLDKVTGGIVVRLARAGERLKLLDGTERVLEADDLVVADEVKALALAGVMGGWDSMITPETKNILVEAAWFDPASVRRSSRRHGLHTDASHRFERGADFAAPPVANAQVSKLILASGGQIEGELVDVIAPAVAGRTIHRAPISLHLGEVTRILGTTEDRLGIPAASVERMLTALGCRLTAQSNESYSVQLPSWRLDLQHEIDLIEEVARVYGYNRFANTLPPFAGTVVELPFAAREKLLRGRLLALGYSEAVSSTFTSVAEAVTFAAQPGVFVPLGNPLNEEAGVMRPSLLPGMLSMLGHNLNRDVDSACLFELGTIFTGSPERVEERPTLAFGAFGPAAVSGPHTQGRAFSFHDMKGAIDHLLSAFSYRSLYFDALPGLQPEWLHPGRSARVVVDGSTLGYFGELHPAELRRRKLRSAVFLGEIYLERLYKHALRQPVARELSRYPAVVRDFSFIFADAVFWEQIADAIDALALPTLTRTQPLEIFRDVKGVAVPTGSYSLLIRTVFQSAERTLREEEVAADSNRIMSALTSLGGRLRSETLST